MSTADDNALHQGRVDFEAIFTSQPTAYLVMTPDLVIRDANLAYLQLLDRTREELVGRYVFDAFPPAPDSLAPDGTNPLQTSFERARDTGRPDHMPLFHYEVLDQRTGRPTPRTWSLISVPVLDATGETQLVLQRVEDVSDYLAERDRRNQDGPGIEQGGDWGRLDALEADLFARTHELQTALELREAANGRLAAMAQVVLQLTDATTVEDITDILAGTGLAAIGADGGAIALRDDAHGVVRLTVTPSLGAGTQQRFASVDLDSRLPAAWVARTGETVVHEGLAESEAWTPEMREAFERSGQRSWITVPLVTEGRLLGSLLAGWAQDRAFSPAEVELVQAFGVQCAQALDRLQALTQERQKATSSRLLAEVTGALNGTLDAEEAVAELARLVVPELADWCLVTLASDEQHTNFRRTLRDVSSWHTDPLVRPLVARYAEVRIPSLTDTSFLAQALAANQTVIVDRDATRRMREVLEAGEAWELIGQLAPDSIAFLPLRGRDRITGMITLFNGPDRGPISAHAITTAEEIAARAGLALDNARLYREQRGLSEVLQRSMLTPPPEPDHVQVVVRYVPAAEAAQVGGDWYDAFLQPAGATVLVIGDVIGHDTQAAAAMGQMRTIVRTLGALDGQGPAAILRQADTVMRTLMVPTMATVAVARLEQTPDEMQRGITRLRWSNAGHPPPFVINPDGTVYPLTGLRADLLLGVDSDAPRSEFEVVLDRESVVVLYTDGLIERRDQDLDTGLQRLRDTLEELAGSDLDDLCDQLLARMTPGNADDDIAIVAVRLHRQDRPRPAAAGPNVIPPNVPADNTLR